MDGIIGRSPIQIIEKPKEFKVFLSKDGGVWFVDMLRQLLKGTEETSVLSRLTCCGEVGSIIGRP